MTTDNFRFLDSQSSARLCDFGDDPIHVQHCVRYHRWNLLLDHHAGHADSLQVRIILDRLLACISLADDFGLLLPVDL